MPLYEYSCGDCGRRFEVLQRMGEGAEGLECPHCKGIRLEKCFSTFAARASSGDSCDGPSCSPATARNCPSAAPGGG
jgi:putative FmdB family regulatory protein